MATPLLKSETPFAEPPLVLDPTQPIDHLRIAALRNGGARWLDVLDDMLVEMAQARAPSRFAGRTLNHDDRQEAIAFALNGRDRSTYAKVVYFPWAHTLMLCLPPNDHYEVRTARNRNRLRAEDQHRLSQGTLAFVGCSVGATIAIACVLQGIGRRLHLMDFDSLGLTNLNRLSMGLPDLGENKAVLLARRLWGLDPYLDVVVHPAGATQDNLAAVVADSDVVIEECDHLATKIAVRRLARARRIAVVMATDDGGGLLDVEDFRHVARPLLHGILEPISPVAADALSPSARLTLIKQIVGPEAPRSFFDSLDDLAHGRLSGISQLSEDVHLAAAMSVRAITLLLLPDRPLSSGRRRADLGLPTYDA